MSVCFGMLGGLIPTIVFSEPPATPTAVPGPRARLSDYAQKHRISKNAPGDPSIIVITDENLGELAAGSELTAVTQKSTSPPVPTGAAVVGNPRAYWRERVERQLAATRRLDSQVKANRIEIARLWEMFYSCDEPDEREAEIRPRLIRKIDDQIKFDRDYEAANTAFRALLDEAQKSGASAGWFQDILNQPVNPEPED